MDKFEQILTESERKKIIGKNKRAIKAALKDVDRDTLKLYAQLIDDAASYACAIYECNLLYIRDHLSAAARAGSSSLSHIRNTFFCQIRIRRNANRNIELYYS